MAGPLLIFLFAIPVLSYGSNQINSTKLSDMQYPHPVDAQQSSNVSKTNTDALANAKVQHVNSGRTAKSGTGFNDPQISNVETGNYERSVPMASGSTNGQRDNLYNYNRYEYAPESQEPPVFPYAYYDDPGSHIFSLPDQEEQVSQTDSSPSVGSNSDLGNQYSPVQKEPAQNLQNNEAVSAKMPRAQSGFSTYSSEPVSYSSDQLPENGVSKSTTYIIHKQGQTGHDGSMNPNGYGYPEAQPAPQQGYGYPSPPTPSPPQPSYGYPDPPAPQGYSVPNPPAPMTGYSSSPSGYSNSPSPPPPPPSPPSGYSNQPSGYANPPAPAPQYGYPNPTTSAPSYGYPNPQPVPQAGYGYPAPAPPVTDYGYGQGQGNLPSITGPGGPGGPSDGGDGGSGSMGGPGAGPIGPPPLPPLPPGGIKGSIDYILIPLILIGISAPIFVVVYVVLGSFEAKLAPVLGRTRFLSDAARSIASNWPVAEDLISSVSRALDNQEECWEKSACTVGTICRNQSVISSSWFSGKLERLVPRSYRGGYRAFVSGMSDPMENCSAFKCS